MNNVIIYAMAVAWALPAWGALDVQTSWFRTSSVDAIGDLIDPDNVSQEITGSPDAEYAETYSKSVGRNDGGLINFASLAYTLNKNSNPNGSVESYSFSAGADVNSSVVNTTGASTEFSFVSSSTITSSYSFALEASFFNVNGNINEFSVWMDGAMLWSSGYGFELSPEPDLGGGEGSLAIYGVDSEFETLILTTGLTPGAGGAQAVGLDVYLGPEGSEHVFEIRTNWSAVVGNASTFEYNLDVAHDLEFTIVPEPKQFWLALPMLLLVFLIRRRK